MSTLVLPKPWPLLCQGPIFPRAAESRPGGHPVITVPVVASDLHPPPSPEWSERLLKGRFLGHSQSYRIHALSWRPGVHRGTVGCSSVPMTALECVLGVGTPWPVELQSHSVGRRAASQVSASPLQQDAMAVPMSCSGCGHEIRTHTFSHRTVR